MGSTLRRFTPLRRGGTLKRTGRIKRKTPLRAKRTYRLGIRISAADKKFSILVRTRDNWTCQRCMKKHPPPTSSLHCCHVFTRRSRATRFSLDNCYSWCYGCHQYMDSHPDEKYEWVIKRIGRERFEALRLQSHLPVKVDERLIEAWVDIELEKLRSSPA